MLNCLDHEVRDDAMKLAALAWHLRNCKRIANVIGPPLFSVALSSTLASSPGLSAVFST